jgi:hypothetical protein
MNTEQTANMHCLQTVMKTKQTLTQPQRTSWQLPLLILFAVLLVAVTASAATRTSTASGGVWGTGSTWVGGVAPAATDSVIIATTGANSVQGNTIGASYTCAALTINSGATLTMYRDFTVNGATTISGRMNFGSTSTTVRTMTFNGAVMLNSGAVWNETTTGAAADFTFGNSLVNNATTFTAQTPVHTFSGTGMTLSGATVTAIPNATFTGNYANSGSLSVSGTLTVTGAAIRLTNNNTVTATTSLAGIGGIINGATGVFNIGGTSGITTLTATAAGNTVNYTGAGQTVKATTYSNLIFSGSGAKTMATGISVNGNLSIAPTGSASASVGTGLNLPVGSLTLGGLGRVNGTWGSTTATSATYQNNTYFAGTTGYLIVSTDTRSTPTITTAPTATTITYGQTLASSTLSGGAASVGATSVPGTFAWTTSSTAPSAGTPSESVAFTPTDTTSYTTASGSAGVTVNPAPLVIMADNQSKAYGAALPGLTVSYSGFVNGDTAASLTVAPTVTTTGLATSPAGSYPITASGAADANYTISYVTGTLTVNPVALTITANNQSKAYGAALPGLTVSYSGFVNGDTAASLTTAPTVTTTGLATSPAGSYPITASGAADANYTIGYVAGTLTVSAVPLVVTANDASRAYGATNPVFSASYTGFVNGETNDVLLGTLVFECEADTNSPVGTYAIEPSGLTAANYSITFTNGTLTVLPYALTVTAEDKSKTYGETDPAFTVSYSGFVNGQDASVLEGTLAISRAAGEDVGGYAITPSGLTSTNYAITFAAGTLTINPAGLTITADNQSKDYGAALPGLTVSYSGFVNGDTAASLTTAPTVTTTGLATSPAGSYPITASGAADANYTISYVAGALTVNPVALTITANDQSKDYGTALPGLTVSYSGFVNGDTAASLTTAPTVTTTGLATSPAGSYPITASGAADANYTIGYVTGALTVNPVALTITANNQSKAYGAALPGLTVSYSGFVNGDTAASLTTAPTVTTTGLATSPAGSYPITASGAADANYTIGYVAGTLTVSAVPLVVTANDASRAYGATNPVFSASYTGFVNGETNDVLLGTLVFECEADTNSPVGTYAIEPSGLTAANYSITFTNGTLTVLPYALTVTAEDKSKTYGETDPAFTVSYSGFVNGQDASVLEGTLAISRTAGEDVGGYAITPSGLTSTNYAITFAAGTLTINPAGLTITADNQSKDYGAALPGLTVSYSGFVNGDTAASLTTAPTVTTTGLATSPAGSYPITASGAADANYTISYVAGALTVNPVALTITANDQSKDYGAALPDLTVSCSGFVNGDTTASLTTAPTVTTTGLATSPAGSYPITASGAADANYTIGYVTGALTVNPVALTITADNQSKAYGAALPGLTVSYSGFVNGDTAASLTVAPTVTTTGLATSPAGSYPITASGAADANYTISYVTGTLTVNPVALTITANNQSKAYGAALPGLTVSYSGFVNGDTAASLTTAPTVTTTGLATSPAGSYPITASGAADANYTIGYVAGTLTVSAVPLVVTANDASRAYGATNPVFSASYTGFVNGETNDVLLGTLVFECEADTNSPVGTYAIEPSGLTAANYSITFTNGTLTVLPYALTVTAEDKSKTYGETDPAFTVSYSGFVNGQDASVLEGTLAISRAAGEDVGGYAITPSGLTSTNYAITFAAGTLTINPAGLTITADNQSKDYGAALPGLTVSYSGFVNGDTAASLTTAPTVTTTGLATSPAGSYPITASGAADANYTISYVAGALTVNPVALTITANDQSKDYGAALPDLTVSYSGFVNGDTAASLTTAPTVTTTGLATSPAASYPITASGAADANYTIGYVTGALTVNPVALTITANDQSKDYGAALPGLTVSYSGFVNGDTAASLTVAPTVTTTGLATSPAGSYPITASGAADANYTIGYVTGALTVNPVALTITANNQSKAYGATLPGLTVSYSGFVNGDTAASLTTAPTVTTTGLATSPAGSYPITASGAADANYTIGYVAGTLTVSAVPLVVTANDASRAYGATNPVFSASYTGFVNGETNDVLLGTLVFECEADTNSPVGTYAIEPSGLTAANYSITFTNGTLTVLPYALTVTAEDKSKTYGETDPAFTVSYSGFVNGQDASVLEGTLAISRAAGEDVGGYAITPSGLTSTNYAITFAAGTLTINPAGLTITADNQSKDYGAALPGLTVSYSGFVNGDTAASLTTAPTVTTTGLATSPAGSYPITASGAADANYTISYVAGALTVNPVALTITANNASRAYGTTNPVFTGTITDLQNGDNITATYTTTATVSSPVGAYSITPTLVDPSGKLNNYTVSSINGTLTISEANSDTVVTSSRNPSLYGSNVTFTVTVTPIAPATTTPRGSVRFYANGIALGGSVALSGGVASLGTAELQVGTNIVGAAYLGDGNYLVSSNSLAQVVSPMALVVTANNASRAYGATNPVFTGTITGLQNGDNITATYTTTATASSPVGAYSITPTLVDPSGKLNNYTVRSTNGTLTISEANSDTVVTSSRNPSLYGSNVTFTVTVTPIAPATTTPRGSIRFYANGIALGGSVALSGGVASLGTAELPVGTNIVGAAYLGDGNYLVSSNSLAQVVSVNVQKPATVGIKDNDDGSVTVSFSGTLGAQYIVQAKSDLASATVWDNVSTNIAGTDGQWTFMDSTTNHPIRFYRAIVP